MRVSIFNEHYVRPNSLKAWILASRPKTLTGAAVPVMIGAALAFSQFGASVISWKAMVLCFLFAFVMQIDANFINDYFDCVSKKDTERRLGPERACQQGWISLHAMKVAIFFTTLIACIIGLPLVYYGGITAVILGLLCVVFCFLYTTLFSSIGLGDLLVLVFFGIVPVCGTWWVCIPHSYNFVYDLIPLFDVNSQAILCSSSFLTTFLLSFVCGLVVDTLLIVNNYRDIDNDREVGKNTLVVLIGKKATEWLYISLPSLAIVIILCVYGWNSLNMLLTFVIYSFYIGTWNKMRMIGEGRELNKVLGDTARNILIFGIITSLIVVLS